MKSFLAVILAAILLFAAGCDIEQTDFFDARAIESFREIPGITPEEISAIETIVAKRDYFSYGGTLTSAAFMWSDGNIEGFSPKFCALLSSLFGIEFRFVYYEWDEMLRALEDGLLDFSGEPAASPELYQSFHMTYPIAGQKLSVYSLNNDSIIAELSLDDARIGFLHDTVTPGMIRANYPINFEAVDVDSYDDVLRMLANGEIDAFVDGSVIDPDFISYPGLHQNAAFPLIYKSLSMATANDELQPIISVMNKYLAAGGIDILLELFQQGEREYGRYRLSYSLTEEEKAYIRDLNEREKSVSVAFEHENYPVSFYSQEDRQYQGFAVDILNEISGLTDIRFEAATQTNMLWPDMLKLLKDGKISMITQLIYSDARQGDYLWSSVPYASTSFALLSKINVPELTGFQVIRAKVGVISQTGHEDMYKLWFPDSGNTVPYSTHEEALTALEHGDIDLLMVSEYTLLHQTNYRERPGFKVNIKFGAPMDSVFGFNKNEAVLRSIVDKSLHYVDMDSFVRSWTSRVFDYSSKYNEQFINLLSFFIVILLSALMLVMYLYRVNIRFRKDIERKTATISAIFNSIPDMLYSKDGNGVYTSCNPSFEELAGIPEEEIVGKTSDEVFIFNPTLAAAFTGEDSAVVRDMEMRSEEVWFRFPDGEQRLFECIKVPLIQNGVNLGMVGISRDITEHKKNEEAAQAASRAKSAFLAHMSHEIRTPMNVISGMTELVMREDIPQTIYEYILGIKHASASLLSLINDILDFSKIEAGSLEIVPVEYSFSSLINDILIIISMKISEKPVRFTANIDSHIPDKLIGDETRIRQIILNLLSNSLKYTKEGFISIKITGELVEDEVLLSVVVEDSGIGIQEKDMERLFDNFVRFDTAKNKDIPGTGLGLAISKNLCQAMGGDITVVSDYGIGSKFTVTVPQKLQPGDVEPFARVQNAESKKVLLFEQRAECAVSIGESLESLGVAYMAVTSYEGLHSQLAKGRYTHIIASSQLEKTVRQAVNETNSDARIVLLMDPGDAPAKRDVRTVSMPAHCASIANILNDMQTDRFHERKSGRVRFIAPTANILIVDDVNTNLKVAEGLMLPYQVHIDVCVSGAEALQHVRRKRYDIIFMDHMMPEMDGLETTARIRALEDGSGYFKSVPILALTANAITGVREMFLNSGMDDFLAKPIDFSKLNTIMEKWIPESKKERYWDTEAERPVDNTMLSIEGINVRDGITMTGGSYDNYMQTLAIFHMDGMDKLNTIRDCLIKEDIKLYTTYVHALKSASASIGAQKISNSFKELEEAGIRGDVDFIFMHTETFLFEFERLLENIKAALPKAKEGPGLAPALVKMALEKLKAALSDMDAAEVDDTMKELNQAVWTGEGTKLFSEMSKCIYVFQYDEAAVLVDDLLSYIEEET